MISEQLAAVLRDNRRAYNRSVADAMVRSTFLRGDDVSTFLVEFVDPLVRSVASSNEDSSRLTNGLPALADRYVALGIAALERRLIGRDRRIPWLTHLWGQCFPAIGLLLVQDPQLLIDLSNAVLHISIHNDEAVRGWLNSMVQLAPRCQTPRELRAFGQLAAWRNGLAHFRHGALDASASVEPSLGLDLFASTGSWPTLLKQLRADAWFDPNRLPTSAPALLATRGSFRGLGGLFLDPPVLISIGDERFVRSGQLCWRMAADAFGATWHRAEPVNQPATYERILLDQIEQRRGNMCVVQPSGVLDLGPCGAITSIVRCGSAIALTSQRSFAVRFIGMPK